MNADPKLKLGMLGGAGRMGAEITKLLGEPRFAARIESVAAPRSGESLEAMFAADVWIDFSSPAGALALVREAVRRKADVPFVVGATGWAPEELRELESAAKSFPILRAANFSLGVEICRATLRTWGAYPELANWKVTLRDLHHAKKKDAPSGTALTLQEALGREVAITSVREGAAVGTHEIVLESASEKLTLIHEAKTRAVFAEGALETAIRLACAPRAELPKRLLNLGDLYLRRGA